MQSYQQWSGRLDKRMSQIPNKATLFDVYRSIPFEEQKSEYDITSNQEGDPVKDTAILITKMDSVQDKAAFQDANLLYFLGTPLFKHYLTSCLYHYMDVVNGVNVYTGSSPAVEQYFGTKIGIGYGTNSNLYAELGMDKLFPGDSRFEIEEEEERAVDKDFLLKTIKNLYYSTATQVEDLHHFSNKYMSYNQQIYIKEEPLSYPFTLKGILEEIGEDEIKLYYLMTMLRLRGAPEGNSSFANLRIGSVKLSSPNCFLLENTLLIVHRLENTIEFDVNEFAFCFSHCLEVPDSKLEDIFESMAEYIYTMGYASTIRKIQKMNIPGNETFEQFKVFLSNFVLPENNRTKAIRTLFGDRINFSFERKETQGFRYTGVIPYQPITMFENLSKANEDLLFFLDYYGDNDGCRILFKESARRGIFTTIIDNVRHFKDTLKTNIIPNLFREVFGSFENFYSRTDPADFLVAAIVYTPYEKEGYWEKIKPKYEEICTMIAETEALNPEIMDRCLFHIIKSGFLTHEHDSQYLLFKALLGNRKFPYEYDFRGIMQETLPFESLKDFLYKTSFKKLEALYQSSCIDRDVNVHTIYKVCRESINCIINAVFECFEYIPMIINTAGNMLFTGPSNFEDVDHIVLDLLSRRNFTLVGLDEPVLFISKPHCDVYDLFKAQYGFELPQQAHVFTPPYGKFGKVFVDNFRKENGYLVYIYEFKNRKLCITKEQFYKSKVVFSLRSPDGSSQKFYVTPFYFNPDKTSQFYTF